MEKKPRVAIYARQSIKKDDGIALQLEHCRKEVEQRGWQVVAEYEDNHVSGSRQRDDASGWAAMLNAFDKGKFDVLIVNEVSRLTRRIVDVLEVRPPKRDIRIMVRRGSIDTDDPMGDFIFKLFVLIAEHEVELKKARAKFFAEQNRLKGHPTPGRVPYGYNWVLHSERLRTGDDTRYVVDEDEKVIVERIFVEYFNKRSMKEIARRLNEDGHRTRSGHMWGPTTVRRILLNPVYAGLLPPSQPTGEFRIENISLEECQPGAWEPIVEYDEIVATRGKILRNQPNHNGTARKWLLPGIAVCGGCGGPIRSAVAKNRPRSKKGDNTPAETYHAYRCATVGNGCFQRGGDIIDEYIKEMCIRRLSREDAAELFVPDDGPDISVLHARREELERRSEFIYEDAARRGRIEAARKSLDELDEELRQVNEQIAEVLDREPLAELAEVEDIRQWWEDASLSQRRAVVQMLMVPTIHPVGMGKRVDSLERAMETVSIYWHRPHDAAG